MNEPVGGEVDEINKADNEGPSVLGGKKNNML